MLTRLQLVIGALAILTLALTASACFEDKGAECPWGCGSGQHCEMGFCVSDCELTCGFNQTCVGDDVCEPAPNVTVRRPAVCDGRTNCYRDLDLGPHHACAVLFDGSTWCWGRNEFGALGDGNTVDRATPTRVSGLDGVADIAAGFDHTCAALTDGRVACWGSDWYYSYGTEPTLVPGLVDIVEVEAGYFHTCGLDLHGDVFCWGANSAGQLGVGDDQPKRDAVVQADIDQVTSLALGGFSSCATRSDGTAWCWGDNEEGQIGDGTRQDRYLPVRVGQLTNVDRIEIGDVHTCATRNGGEVLCWGNDIVSSVTGLDYDVDNLLQPTPVALSSDVEDLGLGFAHSCGLLDDGQVHCWGSNWQGQLGSGSDDLFPENIMTAYIRNARVIDAGDRFTCAVLDDGGIACWGENEDGQLGDGSFAEQRSPVYVAW